MRIDPYESVPGGGLFFTFMTRLNIRIGAGGFMGKRSHLTIVGTS